MRAAAAIACLTNDLFFLLLTDLVFYFHKIEKCRGHPLVGVWLLYEKAQESVSVTVLPLEASRIA